MINNFIILLMVALAQILAEDLNEISNNLAVETSNLVNDMSEDNDTSINISDTDVRSRRKRFIVFDEGSSLQIVFCLTYPTIFAIGDIFLWGYTAALAYDLPQDPYSPFRHHADPLHRRIDTKAIYYTDEVGKIIYKRPYQRKLIVTPAMAKRSTDLTMEAGELKKGVQVKFKIDRKQMHAATNKREFLKREHMDRRSAEFHRSSRQALYQKIETMLQGVGMNGRQCLLKSLCLTGQFREQPQGHFLQEILRAVFTLPKSDDDDYDGKDYDEALSATQSCSQLYPECEDNFHDTDAFKISS